MVIQKQILSGVCVVRQSLERVNIFVLFWKSLETKTP